MKKSTEPAEQAVELLRTMLIVQMALAGVSQPQIRKVVGGAMGDINKIAKLVRIKKGSRNNRGGDEWQT